MRNFFGIFLLMFIFCSQLSAQKQLTLEDFFVDGTFRTKGVYGLRSMNDGEHYTVLENNGTRIVKYSYKTGLPVATLLDLKTQEDSPVSRIDDYTFNADESRILICTNKKPIYRRSFTADYYLFDFKNKEIKPLSEGGSQRLATFSPTGLQVAFVRDNNLFIHDIRFGSERQITRDGQYNHIINGAPDWVYEEEFAFNRAFEWAPDGSAIAYHQIRRIGCTRISNEYVRRTKSCFKTKRTVSLELCLQISESRREKFQSIRLCLRCFRTGQRPRWTQEKKTTSIFRGYAGPRTLKNWLSFA